MTGLAKTNQVGTEIFTAFCYMICVSQLGHINDQHSKIMRACGPLFIMHYYNSDIKNFQKAILNYNASVVNRPLSNIYARIITSAIGVLFQHNETF